MKDIPQGTSELVATVPGGTIPGLTGWLKRAASSTDRLRLSQQNASI